MKSSGNIIRYVTTVTLLLMTGPAWAQLDVDLDRDAWNVAEGDWNNDDNWVDDQGDPSGALTLDIGRWALIGNGGTAIVDDESDTGALSITNGTVDIRQGGSLKIDSVEEFTSGTSTLGRRSNLLLSGNGSYSGKDLVSEGVIALNGPGVSFEVSGNLDISGELHLGVTGAGTPKLTVGGNAVLNGSLIPTFDGVSPGLGDSFEFLSGADAVTDSGVQLVLPDDVVVGRGVSATISTTNSTAAVTFQSVPVLSVNRFSGAAQIMNVVPGGPALEITGYSIFSDNNLLATDDWSSLEDQGVERWSEASPRSDAIAELGFNSTTLEVDGSLSIGNPYNAGPTHPDDEDLRFEASLADGTVVAGLVEYEGPANNLTLTVDPATGQAEISHRSTFIDPIDVTGYTVVSESGALNPDGWTSFVDTNLAGDNWIETTPNETNGLGEFNPSSSKVFSTGTAILLGEIFNTAGLQDLTFQFATQDAVLEGTVSYGPIDPDPDVPGDCNGDSVVNNADLACANAETLAALGIVAGDLDGKDGVAFADFLVLSANFNKDPASYAEGNVDFMGGVAFADFLILSENFGQGGAAAASVPEPNTLGLMSFGALLFFVRRRKR